MEETQPQFGGSQAPLRLGPPAFRLSRDKSQPLPHLKHWYLGLSQLQRHTTSTLSLQGLHSRCPLALAEEHVRKLACISGSTKYLAP